jgi:hypothetical protein
VVFSPFPFSLIEDQDFEIRENKNNGNGDRDLPGLTDRDNE